MTTESNEKGNKKLKIIVWLQVVMIIVILGVLEFFYYQFEIQKINKKVTETGRELSYKLAENVNINISALKSLGYYFSEDLNIERFKFNRAATYYLTQFPDMLYIQYINKDMITDMVYPLKGNEEMLGAPFKDSPEAENVVGEAMQLDKMTVDNPHDLKYSDYQTKGLVIRYPIFNEDRFSGFFVCVMDLNRHIEKVLSENDLRDFNITLYDDDMNVFFNNGRNLSNRGRYGRKDIFVGEIQIEDKVWKIKVGSNRDYWSDIRLKMLLLGILYSSMMLLFLVMEINILRKNQNIEELVRLKKTLQKKEERYRLAIEGANDIIWEWNLKEKKIFISDKWTALTGIKIKDGANIAGQLKKQIHPEDLKKMIKDFKDFNNGKFRYYQSEFRVKTSDGNYKWFYIRGKSLKNQHNKIYKLSGSIVDITEKKNTEEYIKYIAYYDDLTKLPNQNKCMKILEEHLNVSTKKSAIILIDLDDFKKVNDTLGHDYGDKLLVAICRKIKSFIKENIVISRMGGDEFLIIMKDIEDREQVEVFCEKVLEMFTVPFQIENKQVYITASMGIAIHPKDGKECKTLRRNADTAMYEAKSSGRNKFQFFNTKMSDALIRKTEIEKSLRQAVHNREFKIHYQPQYDLKNQRISGLEALLRWHTEHLGFVSPAEFIPIAEETGLIVPIGEWILEEVFRQIRYWNNNGYRFGSIAVNISSVQLQSKSFMKKISEISKQYRDISSQSLEFEITESVLLNNLDSSMKIFDQMKSMGFKIALDDFGTGYSSLNYLKMLPTDTLKIDKLFIDHITKYQNNQSIIDGIIKLAHSMQIRVVAEGVETEEQLQILKRFNCDIIQGFHYCKPLPSEQLEKKYHRLGAV
ncbi:MAG: EAL domain-containing protein [Firmicutes bacterium]|nr:EAL domain-containing protein [Bacillota bacterium]